MRVRPAWLWVIGGLLLLFSIYLAWVIKYTHTPFVKDVTVRVYGTPKGQACDFTGSVEPIYESSRLFYEQWLETDLRVSDGSKGAYIMPESEPFDPSNHLLFMRKISAEWKPHLLNAKFPITLRVTVQPNRAYPLLYWCQRLRLFPRRSQYITVQDAHSIPISRMDSP